ncbi:phasin family protein [Gorillibacterium sp. sgz5001074]|uniref:phasin family protein n=1 Tax=Gorillibacterium sp. sgz5001074 TaxID=3446695 RepID=UPI003F67C7EF
MNELLRKALSLGLGVTMAGKDKIEAFVDDMVKKGELAPSDSKEWISSLLERGERERDELKRLVQEQLQKRLADLNVATKDDITRLEQRLDRLEAPAVPEQGIDPLETPPIEP